MKQAAVSCDVQTVVSDMSGHGVSWPSEPGRCGSLCAPGGGPLIPGRPVSSQSHIIQIYSVGTERCEHNEKLVVQ